ncbi:MAG: hypothetical protein ACFFD4_30440 [Candidatus Odinarchaeota archaeon]
MKIGHESVEMYKEYRFPVTIEITVKKEINGDGDISAAALTAFRNYLEKTGGESGKIVYTRYGNPYDCSFGEISAKSVDGNVVTLQSLGSGIRRYDIPGKRKKKRKGMYWEKKSE